MNSGSTEHQLLAKKYKHGTLYKRSKLLKKWNARSILLNYAQGTLTIRSGTSKKEKIIQLTKYRIDWIGAHKKNKNRFIFTLTAKNKKERNLRYKIIYLSDANEAGLREWYQEIK